MKKRRPPLLHFRSIVRQLSLAGVGAVVLLILLVTTCSPSKSTYHSLFLRLSSNDTAARHLHALTRRPHVAGSKANADAAAYVLETLSSASIPAHIVSYDVLLSYPVHRYLSLSSEAAAPSVSFDLVQEIYPGDPYADVAAEVLPTFHAYARSGTAAGEVVYANYGRVEDFDKLRAAGVNVVGSVVLARYGGIFRGDIIRNAQLAGAIAAIVYTDAKDYGGGARGKWFPNDRWMPPSGVQVGSVFRGLGDPTTPGWASVSDCERVSVDEVVARGLMPGIPSLPVSSRDGEAILKTIGGEVAAADWQGEEGAPVYRLGPGPGFVNLTYLGNETITTIQNVIAVIKGKAEPDRYVIIGNHRDAWTFGAVDPNSGTAALLELAQRLEKLQNRGWKPRRTIVICNWDAEEYHLLGSTEWAEDNREILSSRAVAYLNVDCGVSGPGFHASSTPQLDKLLKEASKKVQDPDNSSQTLYDSWVTSDSPLVGRLGGDGSDYAAFVQHIGVPSVDIRFGRGYPVYHSMYDDFVWMQKYGDPLFHRHVAAASIWGLVALKLADEEFLPFDYMSYASELQQRAKVLENELLGKPVSFSSLYKSIEDFKNAVAKVNSQMKELESKVWLSKWKKEPVKVRELNDRLMLTERAFTDREGLFERPWYKHLIYGPSQHNGYGSESFPGIDDAVKKAETSNTSSSWQSVQHEVWRVARVITQASHVLKGELT
ncbi:probable glutamate carboxypeptidase LAMP1 [Dendrobium catenatum]|uniref:glutamate carboxypeptidase II n=1 Tax=Dendrobium catenatum TaxID=906689 RepID=A0A2I0XDB1_9ASPA|nr:probable glutamate carboxypeptidase LAMP1 [Dendrobium catenatum]PKU85901.1 putative glutamate carboxypeptidase 2 [Dendrobium catenatum]